MRNIFYLAIIGGVFGSSSPGDEPMTDSLLEILHSLRVREGGPWIDEKTYDELLQEGKMLVDAVRLQECPLVTIETPLLDSFNKCFGKSRYESITGKAQFLRVQSCTLARRGSSPPSPPTTPGTRLKKFFASLIPISTDLGSEVAGAGGPSGGGNQQLLHRIIAEGLVQVFGGKDACSDSLKSSDINYQCPVSYDRPVSPNWESVGFPQNEIGAEMKSIVKTLYENLLNRDCIVYKGMDQILRDTNRNPLREKLLDLIRVENSKEESAVTASAEAEAAAAATTTSDAVHQTLSDSIAAHLAQIAKHDSDAVKGQFFRELGQMFETCSEAGLVYSFIARNATSDSNTFYDGRPMEGEKSSQRWRKFSYPNKPDRKIFHYYQGIADICYFVMFYERKPGGQNSPAIYPGKHEMFNVIATIVENIHDVPVGDMLTVQTPYHKYQAEGVFGLVNSVYGLSLPLSTDTEMMAPIGGFLSNIILRSFIDENASLNWVPVSGTDATPRLIKLWFFVFQNGHYGMMAFIVAAYKTLAISFGNAQDILKVLQKPLSALSNGSMFQDALAEAENIIAGGSHKWGDHETFAQFIDEIEIESILKIRP